MPEWDVGINAATHAEGVEDFSRSCEHHDANGDPTHLAFEPDSMLKPKDLAFWWRVVLPCPFNPVHIDGGLPVLGRYGFKHVDKVKDHIV